MNLKPIRSPMSYYWESRHELLERERDELISRCVRLEWIAFVLLNALIYMLLEMEIGR